LEALRRDQSTPEGAKIRLQIHELIAAAAGRRLETGRLPPAA